MLGPWGMTKKISGFGKNVGLGSAKLPFKPMGGANPMGGWFGVGRKPGMGGNPMQGQQSGGQAQQDYDNHLNNYWAPDRNDVLQQKQQQMYPGMGGGMGFPRMGRGFPGGPPLGPQYPGTPIGINGRSSMQGGGPPMPPGVQNMQGGMGGGIAPSQQVSATGIMGGMQKPKLGAY